MTQHNNGLSRTTMAGEVLPPERRGSAVRSDFAGVDTSWRARSQSEKLSRTLQVLTGGLEKCREHNEAEQRYEISRQQLALTRAQAALLPLQLERQAAAIHQQIIEAQTDVDRAMHARLSGQEEARIDRLKREERELEVRTRIRRLEAELAGLIHPAPASPPPKGSTPEAFARHWATEAEVRANRSPAEARIGAIYARAAAERRTHLNPDEIEEVDALSSAAEGAESDIRRRAASGLR